MGLVGAELTMILDAPDAISGLVWGYDQQWFTYKFPVFRLLDVFVGCNLGYIFLHVEHRCSDRVYTVLEVVSVMATVGVLATCYQFNAARLENGVEVNPWWGYCLIHLVSSILLVYLYAIGRGAISNALAKMKAVLHLARLSPYEFIMHVFVFWCIYWGVDFMRGLQGLSQIGNMANEHMSVIRLCIGFPLSIVASELWMRLDRLVRNRHLS